MKLLSAVIIILALVVGIVPQFTDCESQGRSLTLQNGNTVPMKCHWTGEAELALSAPLLGMGVLMNFTRRRESHLSLGVIGLILGAFVILLPTALVGVCASPEMICNSVMKPTLILTGTLLVVASVAMIAMNFRRKDEIA